MPGAGRRQAAAAGRSRPHAHAAARAGERGALRVPARATGCVPKRTEGCDGTGEGQRVRLCRLRARRARLLRCCRGPRAPAAPCGRPTPAPPVAAARLGELPAIPLRAGLIGAGRRSPQKGELSPGGATIAHAHLHGACGKGTVARSARAPCGAPRAGTGWRRAVPPMRDFRGHDAAGHATVTPALCLTLLALKYTRCVWFLFFFVALLVSRASRF